MPLNCQATAPVEVFPTRTLRAIATRGGTTTGTTEPMISDTDGCAMFQYIVPGEIPWGVREQNYHNTFPQGESQVVGQD